MKLAAFMCADSTLPLPMATVPVLSNAPEATQMTSPVPKPLSVVAVVLTLSICSMPPLPINVMPLIAMPPLESSSVPLPEMTVEEALLPELTTSKPPLESVAAKELPPASTRCPPLLTVVEMALPPAYRYSWPPLRTVLLAVPPLERIWPPPLATTAPMASPAMATVCCPETRVLLAIPFEMYCEPNCSRMALLATAPE
jgi:hypothetical protein